MYAHVGKHGGSISTLARESIANAIGRPELAEVPSQGRPRREEEPESKPKKTRGRPKK